MTDPSLYELDEIERFKETNEDTNDDPYRFEYGARYDGFGSIKFGAKMRVFARRKLTKKADLYSGDGTWFLSDQALLPNGAADSRLPDTRLIRCPDNRIERDILAGGVGIDFEDLDSEIDSNVADFKYSTKMSLAAYAMATWDNERVIVYRSA